MPRELTIDERFTLIGQGIDPDDVEAIDDSEVEAVDESEIQDQQIPISTNDKQANSTEKPGLWDRATTPLLPIPRTTGAELNQALPWLNPTVAKVIAGGQQAMAGLGESFTSPLGIGTLGLGPLGGLAAKSGNALVRSLPRLISGGFAVDMGSQIPGGIARTAQSIGEGDVEGSVEGGLSTLGTGLFTGLAGKHALTKPKGPAVEVPPEAQLPYSDLKKPILELPLETPSTIHQREQLTRAGEVLENAVSEQLSRPSNIDIQSFIDESLGVNRKKKDFPRPPAKENYLIDVEAQRVRDALPEDVTRELQKRPSTEGGKVIDVEGEVVSEPASIQLPDFLKSPSEPSVDPRLPTIYREQFKGQELPRDTSKAAIDTNVQSKLVEQGFSPEQITGMSPDTANALYNKGIKASELEPIGPVNTKPAPLAVDKTRYTPQEPATEFNPQKGKVPTTPMETRYSGLPQMPEIRNPIRSNIDRVKELGPTGNYLGDTFNKTYEAIRKYTGRLFNTTASELQQFSKAEIGNAFRHLEDLSDTGRSPIVLTPREQNALSVIRNNMKLVRDIQNNELKIPVDGKRKGSYNENYIPQIMSPDTIRILTEKQGTPEFDTLRNQYLKYQTSVKGKPLEDAHKQFNEIVESFGSNESVNKASSFGPIDKAEGFGIPKEWREQDPMRVLERYNNRVAKRFGYFESIENDPIAREILGIQNDVFGNPSQKGQLLPGSTTSASNLAGNPTVQAIMRDIGDMRTGSSVKMEAMNQLAKSLMMGYYSAARDVISSHVIPLKFMMPQNMAQATLSAWANIGSNIAESFKQGVNRHNLLSWETSNDFGGKVVNNIRNIARGLNTIQLRNKADQVSRGIQFGMARYLGADYLWKEHQGKGNKQSRRFLDLFYPEWQSFKAKGEFSADALNTIASRFVERSSGTYDYRGQPSLTIDHPYAPIFSLTKWSFEQSNNFLKDVVQPLKEGNPWPLLMSTIGASIGGTAVSELYRIVNGKRDNAPTFEEAIAAKEIASAEGKELNINDDLFYKALTMAEASGFAGFLGTVGKSVMDASRGNIPQGIGNPGLQFAEESISTLFDMVEALSEGDFEVGFEGLSQIVANNIQTWRLINNQLASEDDKSKKTLGRDFRIYNQLTDKPSQGWRLGKQANPFMNTLERDYKQASDVEKAGELLPEVVKKLVRESNNDPQILMDKLEGLKNMGIHWAPSAENNPEEFVRYTMWLKNTQGPEKAEQFLERYLKQVIANDAKKEMIPL